VDEEKKRKLKEKDEKETIMIKIMARFLNTEQNRYSRFKECSASD
jgi:hypothetical protein